MDKQPLCGLTLNGIADLTCRLGFTTDHAHRISISIYRKHTGIADVKGIPGKLKNALKQVASDGLFPPVSSEKSDDGTVKYLFISGDGKKFETVYIPEKKRKTVCVSSQSGCRMGCAFCLTGKYGFHGNLTTAEIINQVISIPEAGFIDHVVFMGMGEPMDNIDNVLRACEIMTAGWGMAISPRNITVSSVGITPGISRFLSESRCNLAVSLFSPFPEERKKLVPAENKYPVHGIIDLMKEYPLKKKRRLSLSCVMIKDINDTGMHLEEMKNLLKGSEIRINLLPYHSVAGDRHVSSPAEKLQHFRHNLVVSGISASVRRSRGSDISAACGLLATALSNRSPVQD